MYRYHVWCDIESGSDGIQFEIKDPPYKWNIECDNVGASTAAVHLCQGKNALVVLDCQKEADKPDLLIQSSSNMFRLCMTQHCSVAELAQP
jgi:hypothetical protein